MAKLLGAVKVDALQKRIDELAKMIRPVAARNAEEGKVFDGAVTQLRETIAQRVRFLGEELKTH
jgi:hypothetical protein